MMALFAWAAPGGQAPTPGRGSAALRRDGLDGECAPQAIIVVPRCRLAPPPNVWLGSIDYAAAYPYRFRRALQRAGSGTGSNTPTPSASPGSSLLPSSFLQLSRRQALQSTSSCSPRSGLRHRAGQVGQIADRGRQLKAEIEPFGGLAR